MSPKETAYIVERLAVRFMSMVADYERKLVEHRDAFGARTSADAKIIEGLRAAADEQVLSASKVAYVLRCAGETPVQAAQRVVKERDGLLTQVQDQRAEIERLKLACDTYAADWDTAGKACRIRVDEYPLSSVIRLVRDDAERAAVAKRLVEERDKLRAEVTALKHEVDTLSCPYVSGQRVRVKSEGGLITQQSEYGIGKIGIINAFAFVARIGSRGWVDLQDIEPCDPPVDHDTPAGKEAAVAAAKDEIKVGDLVEVFQATRPTTTRSDIGAVGIVDEIVHESAFVHEYVVISDNGDPATRLPFAGMASICDVRKVPQ